MKHMTKKGIALVLATVMLLLTLSACKEETPPVDSDTEVTDTESAEESQSESETVPAESETESAESESESEEPEPVGYDLSQYTVVRPDGADSVMFDMTLDFMDTMADYGISMDIKNDWATTEEEIENSDLELLFGHTNRPATAQAWEDLPEDKDYVIRFFENKIVILGRTNQSQKLAFSAFFDRYVKKADNGVLTNVAEGEILYGVDPAINQSLNPRGFEDFPRYTRGYDDAKACAYDVVQYFYKDVTEESLNEYIARLANDGFTKRQDHSVTGLRSVTFTKEDGMVHLAYRTDDSTLTVSADYMASDVYTKPAAGSWEVKYEKSSFAVMTMDYSNYSCAKGCNPIYDNNGLCYVVTLQDGRYIVYDGGYKNANDAQILYEFLRDNNRREGNPVIAAWVLTHSHSDHYGAFLAFTENFSKQVTVENFVLNTGAPTCYTGGHDTLLEAVGAYAKTYYGGAKVLQPHIGQRLYFCDVELETLYTHEMFHFNGLDLTNENSASLVTRLLIDGVSLLITGDANRDTNREMVGIYDEYLKSDFVQVAHHGNGGFSEELLRESDPDYILWTTSQPGFRRRTAGKTYSVGMPSSYDAALNKKAFEMVGGTRESIDANGAINNWCADGPVEIMTFGENKTVNITYYNIREELLPNNPIEAYDAEFLPDPRQ